MRGFFQRIGGSIRRFMVGRYGMDQFGKFLLYICFFFLIISFFIRNVTVNRIFYYIAFALLIYGYFRIFSRNIYKRSSENTKYLFYKQKVTNRFQSLKNNSKDCYTTSDYKIFKCPSCKQKLRVPRGKGKIQISCRRCGTSFIKKT